VRPFAGLQLRGEVELCSLKFVSEDETELGSERRMPHTFSQQLCSNAPILDVDQPTMCQKHLLDVDQATTCQEGEAIGLVFFVFGLSLQSSQCSAGIPIMWPWTIVCALVAASESPPLPSVWNAAIPHATLYTALHTVTLLHGVGSVWLPLCCCSLAGPHPAAFWMVAFCVSSHRVGTVPGGGCGEPHSLSRGCIF
jgi:hypothetical protein